MRSAFGWAMLIMSLLASDASARIWYVKPDSTGQAINIQAGIDSSAAGDTVLVASGLYRGDGNRDIDFRGKPIVVLGECRYDTTITDSTVIDCGGVFYDVFHRGLFFHSGETVSSVLEGVVVMNGVAPLGGGILCDSTSSPVIKSNVIRDCQAFDGGAICSIDSSPVIRGNQIYNNTAPYDAGVVCGVSGCQPSVYCSPEITDNIIRDNRSHHYMDQGGALTCIYCDPVTIRHNRIYRNSAASFGGVSLFQCSAVILDNEIRANHADGYAGGIPALLVYGSTAVIVHNSICDNTVCQGPIVGFDGSTAVMEDNYIHGNNSSGVAGSHCIGVYNSKVTIHRNIISANREGGIYILGESSGTVEDNVIEDQTRIGAIACYSPVTIARNVIRNNIGGGILCASSTLIEGNLIVSNSSSAFISIAYPAPRAAISCEEACSPIIVNNTIADNSMDLGAIRISADSHPRLERNIVAMNRHFSSQWDGTPPEAGGISSCSDSVSILYCDVYGNEGGNYIGLPDQTGVNGNISVDPIFCDQWNGNFTLHIESPCLPGHHPDGVSCGLIGALGMGCETMATMLREYHAEVDISGVSITWVLSEAGRDMEFSVLRAEVPESEYSQVANASISRDGLTFTFKDVTCKHGTIYRYRVEVTDKTGRKVLFETEPMLTPAARLTLHQNYPNPFNPSTSIRYELPARTRVILEVYDVSGTRVARLVDEEQERGAHAVEWRGTDARCRSVASGVYLYRLTAGKETISRKMVLLR
jgi:parallel beta-helix repeat protein